MVLSYSDTLLTNVDGTQEHWAFTALESLSEPLQRGAKMLEPVHMWWVPNRGLFRLNKARQINGLKRHGAGEFSSDWPWLFQMSLLGEFARVPETLCFKYYKEGSLSRSWDFSAKQNYEVRVSYMRELWNSGLSSDEKVILSGPLSNQLIKSKLRKKTKLWRLRLWILRLLLKYV